MKKKLNAVSYTVHYTSAVTRNRQSTAARNRSDAIKIARLLDNEGARNVEVSFYAQELGHSVPVKWQMKNPIRDDHVIAIEGDAGGGWIDSVNYPHENPRGRRRNPAPKRQQMARIRTTMPDGTKTIETVPILFRFTVYIGNVAEKFHARKDRFNQLVVSEESTGLSVGTVPAISRAAAVGNDRLAAKSFVEETAERVGAEKFRAAIAKAGPI